ncbi:MAG: hypothetical protein QF464_03870, partial [Myxococcota bacterium]|nr:hypothetical protein [Myxococcota bacterium]
RCGPAPARTVIAGRRAWAPHGPPDAATPPDTTPVDDTTTPPDTTPAVDTTPAADATTSHPDAAAHEDVGTHADTAPSADVATTSDVQVLMDAEADDDTTPWDTAGTPDTAGAEDAEPTLDASAEDTPETAPTEDAEAPGTECVFGGLPACPEDEYCDTGGCGLGLVGECTDKPLDCEIAGGGLAVCACDGNTYTNECFARQAGQRPIGPAPCPATEWNCTVDTSGWGFGEGCGLNEYCYGGCVGEGFCRERPICGNQQMNVQCGCNGFDYGSPCLIASSGKNLEHPGWCGEPNYGTVEACGGEEDFVCSVETDHCDRQSCEPDADGLCVGIWIPGVSPGELCLPGSPEQCGCDDVTYTNKCQRILAGVALKHEGACGMSSCGLDQSGECGMGLYCMGPIGDCSGDGVCKSSPFLCGLIPGGDLPVCGCDDNTYDSLCHAQQADISVSHYGECQD